MQSNDMRPLRVRMIGTWTLLSWTRLVSGVKELGPFGTDALGQISYSSDGYMSAHLMGRNRAKFGTDDVIGSRSMSTGASCCIESRLAPTQIGLKPCRNASFSS